MTRVDGRGEPLTDDERDWLRTRTYLRRHRYELSVAAAEQLYPDLPRVAGTPLLTSDAWMPTAGPVPLGAITLEFDPGAPPAGAGPPSRRYSDLVRRLAAPAVFDNRPTYRLRAADLRDPHQRMRFGTGEYFDGIDTGEAVAHEYAALSSRSSGAVQQGPLRAAVGSPVDPARRPTNVAISALTIRHDRATHDARFLLHWRDPAKVGHAGGLFQVLPVGIFQPATDHPDSVGNDFSLWRCLVREYAEELLGQAETPADAGPVDYDRWPLAAQLTGELERGTIGVHCLGMGVDPLTLATDLLCAVVIEAAVFDRLFGALVSHNAEGSLVGQDAGGPGIPFVADEVERLARREPMQAAGAAALCLAWEHRAALLSGCRPAGVAARRGAASTASSRVEPRPPESSR